MILLKTTTYGEQGLILHTYSLEGGRVNYLIRNRKNNTKFPKGALHPFSILAIEEVGKKKPGELKVAKEFHPIYNLDNLRCDIVKTTLTMFLAEVLYRTLNEGITDKDLYNFIEKSILSLNNLESNYANFHIWFLIAYISKLGFLPDLDTDSFFSQEEKALLKTFTNSELNSILLHPLTKDTRFSLCCTLIEYIKLSLGYNNMEIKSLDVLHQIFR